MKTIFAVCAAILAVVVWQLFARAGTPDHFGQPFVGSPAVSIEALVDRPQDHLKKPVRITGLLTRQCPATGHWYFLTDSKGKELKVEMADETQRLPARVGWHAVVEGQLIPFGNGTEFLGVAAEFLRR